MMPPTPTRVADRLAQAEALGDLEVDHRGGPVAADLERRDDVVGAVERRAAVERGLDVGARPGGARHRAHGGLGGLQALGVDVHQREGRRVGQLGAAQDVAHEVAREDRRAGADEGDPRHQARRSSFIDRAGTGTSPREGQRCAPGSSAGSKVSSSCTHSAAEAPRRQREGHVLVVGVEEQQERVVLDRLAARRAVGDLLAVEEDAEDVGGGLLPVALGHAPAVGAEPPDVGQARALALAPGQELAAAEDRVGLAQLDQALGELEVLALALAQPPLEPGDLVVLAPGVVVAVLGAAELVAAEQHRHALREEQRGEEVALLAPAQLDDLGVVGLALDAAVPRAVVVGAVAVVLAVGLVVLLVVGRRGRAA